MKIIKFISLVVLLVLTLVLFNCRSNTTASTVTSEKVFLEKKYMDRLPRFVGKYNFKQGYITITLVGNQLQGQPSLENRAAPLTQTGELDFDVRGEGAKIVFKQSGDKITGIVLKLKEGDFDGIKVE